MREKHKSPTKWLAEKYGVSESRIRELKKRDESDEDEVPKVDRWAALESTASRAQPLALTIAGTSRAPYESVSYARNYWEHLTAI